MSAMNMKEALAKARRLWCRVTMVNRTGEWRVSHPDDPSQTVTCSNHRKDAPRHLLVLLKNVERDAEDARFKARTEPLLAARKERPSPEYAKPGFIHKPVITPVVPVRTPEYVAPTPEPVKENVMDEKRADQFTTKVVITRTRSFYYKASLDEYVRKFAETVTVGRGFGTRLYAALAATQPALLIDETGRPLTEALVSKRAFAVLRGTARRVKVKPDPNMVMEIDALRTTLGRQAEMIEAQTRRIASEEAALNDLNNDCARYAEASRLGEVAFGIVVALVRNRNVETLQTLIDLAKS